MILQKKIALKSPFHWYFFELLNDNDVLRKIQ